MPQTRCYVIAEASGNHHQDVASAEALVHLAAQAGADAVKFQTFTPEEICADIPLPFGHDAHSDAWFTRLGATTMRDLFAHGGLPRAWHAPLKATADALGIDFLSTPFSVDAARFLVEEIGVPRVKIASGDLTFTPLLDYLAATGLPLILSTGGATWAEVREAVYGPLDVARRGGRLTVLHCCSVYPSAPQLVNLRCLTTLAQYLGVSVGFSDHTLEITTVPMLAIAQGAVVIEKHLRLAGDMTSIDSAHSLEPWQFREMVARIREAEAILGDGVKAPCAAEMHDRVWARRDPSDWLRPLHKGREGAWE